MEENAVLEASELVALGSVVDAEKVEEGETSVDPQDPDRTSEETERHEDPALSTDRIALDALEDLFTERTDDGDEEKDTSGLLTARSDEGDAVDEEQDDTREEESQVSQRTESRGELATSSSISRAASPPVDSPLAQRSPSRPTVPTRPPRSGVSTPTTPAQAISYHNNTTNNQSNWGSSTVAAPLQLVSFDVGGRLFRCKVALVRKFPDKRLFHVMTCGCEQIDRDTFFIDRNPQHFEIILDWYRTGKPLRALPPHVNEDALKDDAKYFDLFDELFPVAQAAPPVPSRVKILPPSATTTTALPKLPERPSRQPTPAKATINVIPVPSLPTKPMKSKADKRRAPSAVCRFTKSETRLVPPVNGSLPVWFAVRSHEHLVVESVKGSGKLLVRVTDPTGMARVFVDQAVLFDSRSWFYLTEDGRAKLQHCVLPGNHVYTFWTERTHEQLPSQPPQTLKAKAAEKPPKGKATAAAAPPPAEIADLEVEFKLISTFVGAEEVEENAELDAVLQAKGKGWSEDPAVSTQRSLGGDGASVCLFLPPREELPPKEPEKPVEDSISFAERDAIAEQIRAVADKDCNQKKVSASQEAKSPGNALKRNGAAIAQPPQQKSTANKHGEKITVYQPMEPLLASAPSPRGNAAAHYNPHQPRRF